MLTTTVAPPVALSNQLLECANAVQVVLLAALRADVAGGCDARWSPMTTRARPVPTNWIDLARGRQAAGRHRSQRAGNAVFAFSYCLAEALARHPARRRC